MTNLSEDILKLGNITVNTDMIEEDVIRTRMGLDPKPQYSHYSVPNEDYFEELNDYLDGTMGR